MKYRGEAEISMNQAKDLHSVMAATSCTANKRVSPQNMILTLQN